MKGCNNNCWRLRHNSLRHPYTPVTGGERVENHKWVIQERIKDANDKELESGTEVTIEANHMKGMKGAIAEIDSAEKNYCLYD